MRAVLFLQPGPGENAQHQEFEGPECMEQAHRLKQSIERDFPNGLFAIRGDDEATAEYAAQRTAAMLGITVDEARVYSGAHRSS